MSYKLKALICTIAALVSAPCYAQSSGERIEAAISMMGVVGFVEVCDNIEADLAFARNALENLNVSIEDIRDNSANLLRASIISANMKKNKDANCRLVWEQFGPDGAALRGLVRKRQ